MKYAIISDIHSNLEALNAVLDSINTQKVNQIICLGDVVGYGPNPTECIQTLRKLNAVVIGGNHDLAVTGRISYNDWRIEARKVFEWTDKVLSDDDFNWLEALPRRYYAPTFEACHGTPRSPIYEYMEDSLIALENVKYVRSNIIFTGHTHYPAMFQVCKDNHLKTIKIGKEKLHLKTGDKLFVNPGSVGQPRDYDKRASYMTFDSITKHIALLRVNYPFRLTQIKMRRMNFPEMLIERLQFGR
jgi:predicted phosphodiesterase